MYTTEVYAIYWTPNNTIPASFKNLIERYFQDLGGTPFLNIVTQYYDTVNGGNKTYIQNVETLGGSWTDTTNAYPHAGTVADPLTDSDIQGEVDNAIAANGWPTGLGHMFFVFTEKGVESCDGGGNCTPGIPVGSSNVNYCAYHSYFNSGSNERIYANMPYVATWPNSCNNTTGQPNNFDADLEISTTSHEEFEAITDPEPNSNWTDGNCSNNQACGEIGDKCQYLFNFTTTNPDGSDLTLKGHPYSVQPEWSNAAFTGTADSGCTHDYHPAQVIVNKTGPGVVTAGSSFQYNIAVTNNGSPTAETPLFSDALASFLKFGGMSQPAGWTCTTPPIGGTGTINCSKNNGYMQNGETASFPITVTAASNTPNGTTLSNTGKMAWDTKYTNHLDATSSTSADVITSADLAVTKTTGGPAVAGQDLNYVIDLDNLGPSDAQNGKLVDPVPTGTTFAAFNSAPGWTCTTPAVGATGSVNCTKATVPAGASDSFTLTVHVPASTASGANLTNTVNVSSDTSDPISTNNSATVNTAVTTSADLQITKTTPNSVIAGNNVAYGITVANVGPSDAQAPAWSDTIPAGTTFVSVTQNSGPTFTCSGTTTVNCSATSLASGATATFTLTVHLDAATAQGSQLCNTATVSGTTGDPNALNNQSQACGTVQTSADLALAQTGSTKGSPGKGTATFSLTITNNGPSDSQNVALTTTSALFSGPPPTIVATGSPTCTPSGSTVTCVWNTIAAGGQVNASITVPWRSGVGQVCDNGSVASGTPDPNAQNNTSSVCLNKKK